MAKCSECDGHCCKYISIPITKPKENIDFEEIKWWLCHKNVSVYKDHDNEWFVEVITPCKYQDPKTNLCTIYRKRSKVCKDHQTHECEANGDSDSHYKVLLSSIEDVDKYRKELKAKKRKRRKK